MNLKQAIEILKTHNQWRRGALIEQASPKELGIAIDIIVNNFEKDNDWIDEAWADSQDSEDLTGAIERYHEYQRNKNR